MSERETQSTVVTAQDVPSADEARRAAQLAVPIVDQITLSPPGLSLRDWFAGMVLQGLMAAGVGYDSDIAETLSYQKADGMLVEREKHGQ